MRDLPRTPDRHSPKPRGRSGQRDNDEPPSLDVDGGTRFERTIQLIDKKREVADAAVKRVPLEAGKVVRRTIVLCILFGTIIAPFILPFFSIPTVVELEESRYAPLDFFGLFGKNTYISFQTINGFLFTTENRQILVTIVGFYFGQASARVK